jgi:hypothetical protein
MFRKIIKQAGGPPPPPPLTSVSLFHCPFYPGSPLLPFSSTLSWRHRYKNFTTLFFPWDYGARSFSFLLITTVLSRAELQAFIRQYKPHCKRSYMKQWTRDLICKTLILGTFAVRQSVAVTHTGLHGRMLGKELTEREKVPGFSNIPALTWRRWWKPREPSEMAPVSRPGVESGPFQIKSSTSLSLDHDVFVQLPAILLTSAGLFYDSKLRYCISPCFIYRQILMCICALQTVRWLLIFVCSDTLYPRLYTWINLDCTYLLHGAESLRS